MRIELTFPEHLLLQEIADPKFFRNDVAQTYALALRSDDGVDWAKVNKAIIKRWSPYALIWIKERAWSGKCFKSKKNEISIKGPTTIGMIHFPDGLVLRPDDNIPDDEWVTVTWDTEGHLRIGDKKGKQ